MCTSSRCLISFFPSYVSCLGESIKPLAGAGIALCDVTLPLYSLRYFRTRSSRLILGLAAGAGIYPAGIGDRTFDFRAANMTGLARATEYEKPCLAIAQPFFLQCFVPTLWNGDALQQVAPLADLQCCSGEFANLTFGELTRSSTGMNASHEQNLTAEVVAQSRQKSLVKIHRVQCPARKHFTLQSISDLPPCEIGAQNVWAYALEEGMLINKFRVPNTDIRCTVEEGTVAVGM